MTASETVPFRPSRPLYAGMAAFLLCCVAGTVRAQDPEMPVTALSDTAKIDTMQTLVIAGMGQLESVSDTSSLHYTNFLWTDTRALQDLFRLKPGVFLRELGRPGLPDQLVFGGLDGARTLTMIDGRPLTDPVTGIINPYEIPVEFVDHLELKTFARAFVKGPNAQVAAMNVVSRQYNTSRPITKVRFMQGPYEHLLTDALFTQNVVRPVNVLFGLQRQVSDNRFLNSSYDSWNVRSRVRYNVTRRINLSLTDWYRKSTLGMNNGIDIDSTTSLGLDPFNVAEAVPLSESAMESITRRDVTLAMKALAFDDSLSPTQVSLYFTTAERHYSDPTGRTGGPFDNYAYEVHGFSVRQSVQAGPVEARIGGQVERRIAGLGPSGAEDTRMLAWYADASADFLFLHPTAMLRGERNGDGQGFSWGIQANVFTGNGFAVTGGWSDSRRFPTLQELHWPLYSFTGSPNLVETHRMAHLGLNLKLGVLDLSADVSQRTIENAILFKAASSSSDFPAVVAYGNRSLTLRQVSGSATLALPPLEAMGGVTWTETRENEVLSTAHPRLIMTGEVSYRDTFFDEALEARFTLQARFVSSHRGMRFFPVSGIFAENTGKTVAAFSTLDLYGVFHIGDAFLNITWENPLDREFFTVYPYPAMGRNIKVGINWIFLD